MLQKNRSNKHVLDKEIFMIATPQRIKDAAMSNLDSALTMASSGLVGIERIAALNLNTARNVIAHAAENSKAVFSLKSAEELRTFQTESARPALDAAVTYWRAAYAICTETAEDVNRIAGAQLNTFKADASAAIGEALKSAPAGSEPVLAAFKSTMAATDSAYNVIAKAAKQVGELAESNVTAATDTAVKTLASVTAIPKGKKKAA